MSNLKDKIREAYSAVVQNQPASSSCCGDGKPAQTSSCCGAITDLKGLSEDYSSLPGYTPDADYGLGCGIPVAFAGIEKGQSVLDLGSGAGNDAFVARSLVGETGTVTGIDMTPAMIDKANENKKKLGFENVEFVLGDIEKLPFEDQSFDTVISNCVLNLVNDKQAAYNDIYRVLKPNGHFCISDVVVSGPLPEKMAGVAELYAGCISGAMVKEDYLETIKKAGFGEVEINKEKTIDLPDDFLLNYLSEQELTEFRSTNVQIMSITVTGQK